LYVCVCEPALASLPAGRPGESVLGEDDVDEDSRRRGNRRAVLIGEGGLGGLNEGVSRTRRTRSSSVEEMWAFVHASAHHLRAALLRRASDRRIRMVTHGQKGSGRGRRGAKKRLEGKIRAG